MSRTHSDTLITVSSSFDLGGDVSKDPTQTEAYTPPNQIETLLPEIPDDWKPPARPFAQFCFTKLCLFTLGKPDLEELSQKVSQEDNWYNRVMCMHDSNLYHPAQLFYGASAYVMTMLMLPASIEPADRTYRENYKALIDLGIAACGAIFQAYFIVLQLNGMKKVRQIVTRQPGKMVVLTYLTLFRMVDVAFPLAGASLAILHFIAFMGVNPVNYWMSIVGACTLALFLDPVFEMNMRAMILRGVLAVVMWLCVAFGYFQRNCDGH